MTSAYGLDFVDDATCSRAIRQKRHIQYLVVVTIVSVSSTRSV